MKFILKLIHKIHYLSSKVTKKKKYKKKHNRFSTQYYDKLYETKQVVEVRIATKMISKMYVCMNVFSVQMNVDNSCQKFVLRSFFFFFIMCFKTNQLIREMYRKCVCVYCVIKSELSKNQYETMSNSQRNYQIGSCQFDNCRISTLVSFWTFYM